MMQQPIKPNRTARMVTCMYELTLSIIACFCIWWSLCFRSSSPPPRPSPPPLQATDLLPLSFPHSILLFRCLFFSPFLLLNLFLFVPFLFVRFFLFLLIILLFLSIRILLFLFFLLLLLSLLILLFIVPSSSSYSSSSSFSYSSSRTSSSSFNYSSSPSFSYSSSSSHSSPPHDGPLTVDRIPDSCHWVNLVTPSSSCHPG